MNTFKITFPLIEDKHYFPCQDVIDHPLLTEAFKYGDAKGKGYDSVSWEGEIYAAQLETYQNGKSEVFIGEWLGEVGK